VAVLTVFLPLGPTGQAGCSIILIGQSLESLLRTIQPLPWFLAWPYAGQVLYMLCVCIAFLLWTLSTLFLVFSLLAMSSMLRKKTHIVFSPKFWGLVFPNGVYAILSIMLGEALDSSFFRVYGALFAAATSLLWLSIMRCSLVYMHGAVSRSTSQAIHLL
jgi:tellurite resistance protein TehA-like permease